jgi:hypothetical protein
MVGPGALEISGIWGAEGSHGWGQEVKDRGQKEAEGLEGWRWGWKVQGPVLLGSESPTRNRSLWDCNEALRDWRLGADHSLLLRAV